MEGSESMLADDVGRIDCRQRLQLIDDFFVPAPSQRGDLLAAARMAGELLVRPAGIDREVLLHRPDHRDAGRLTAWNQLGEHWHDRR